MHEYYMKLISHTAVTHTVTKLSKTLFHSFTPPSFAVVCTSISLSHLSLTLTFIPPGKVCWVLTRLSESTCLMFILLWNQESISIGCWAVSPEHIEVKRPAQSQLIREWFLFTFWVRRWSHSGHSQVSVQHHPPIKAPVSSRTLQDHGEVGHAYLQRHHPHPEHLLYLLSDCPVILLLDRLLVNSHTSSHSFHLINIHVLISSLSHFHHQLNLPHPQFWVPLSAASLWLVDVVGLYIEQKLNV